MPPVQAGLIYQIIRQDIEASTTLLALLKTEQEALKSRHHQDLEQLVAEKSLQMQILETNVAKRQQLLKQVGMPDTLAAWEELLATITKHPDLSATNRVPSSERSGMAGINLLDDWQTLKENFAKCQRLNEINGKLIARGQQTIARLLNILRGQTGAPGLYTQTGGTQRQGGSYTIVKA